MNIIEFKDKALTIENLKGHTFRINFDEAKDILNVFCYENNVLTPIPTTKLFNDKWLK